MSGSVQVVQYDGITGVADSGYSSGQSNLNVFYEVRRNNNPYRLLPCDLSLGYFERRAEEGGENGGKKER